MPSYPGFLGPAYQAAAFLADQERLINWFPELNQSQTAPTPGFFQMTPGVTAFSTRPDDSPTRGCFTLPQGPAFWVAGDQLFVVGTDGNNVVIGTVQNATTPVTFAWNGVAGGQVFLTSGGVGYLIDVNSLALSTVLASGADYGGYLDGYFLALDAATGTLQLSGLLDGSTWDPTQVAQRSAAPDPWVALYVWRADIWLFGEQTSEVWADVGTFPFPFAMRSDVGVIQQGIWAPYSVQPCGIALAWVGQDDQGKGIVWRADNYVPTKISTPPIDGALQRYSTTGQAVGWHYQQDGHYFYGFNVPDQTTWVFDATTELWHERGYWNITTAQWEPYRLQYFMAFPSLELLVAGDRASGTLYTLSSSVYTDVDGRGIRRLRQPPRLSFDQKRFSIPTLQLICDVGIGLSTGQGSDPQVMLRTSKDGGHSFGPEYWVSAGAVGTYATRVRWTGHPGGQCRNRVDQFVVSDPVPWRLVDVVLPDGVQVGTS